MKGGYEMAFEDFKARFVKAQAEAWYKGNLDALDDVDDPDIVVHMIGYPDFLGREGHKQYIAGARKAFSDYRQEWADLILEGDTMAARYTAQMKHTGPSPMIPGPPTGKELTVTAAMFFHLKNDKIVEMFIYSDNMGLMQQLGLLPPMGAK
jgi:predicted ester cyclase